MAARVVPVVDRSICTGAGMCTVYAPATFEVDADARAVVVDALASHPDALAAAAESCPSGAIQLVDADREENSDAH